MDSPSAPPTESKPLARWPGVIFSLLVPGFGLFRAGKYLRGAAWLLGLQAAGVFTAAVFASLLVPFWLGVVAYICFLGLWVWMLCDGFRPGRMTWKLWLLFVALAVLLAALPSVSHLTARAFKVPTDAMAPTLQGAGKDKPGDQVSCDRLAYVFSKPRRGDVVVFATSGIPRLRISHPTGGGEVYYMKRVVGLPGERIQIRDGSLYADGRKLGPADGIPQIAYTEPRKMSSSAMRDGEGFVVGEDEYFVMGDNSPNSFDSRYWGGVPAKSIYGRVTKIYFPFDRMGVVK